MYRHTRLLARPAGEKRIKLGILPGLLGRLQLVCAQMFRQPLALRWAREKHASGNSEPEAHGKGTYNNIKCFRLHHQTVVNALQELNFQRVDLL